MGKTASKKARTEHYGYNVRFAKKPNKTGHSSEVKTVKAKKKRRQRKLPPYMTVVEKERFFKAITSTRDRAIFRMMYHHGLRVSEIGKLQLSDYRQGSTTELDRVNIHRLKGSISGECPVVPTAALAVRAWLRKRGYKPGALFPSRLGTPIKRTRIFEMMQAYCKIAQIPLEKAHPHCLKHTCCTHLISDQGESIMDVRKHVGHVNIRSTMVYADLTDEANEARAKRLREWR
jgi:integrase